MKKRVYTEKSMPTDKKDKLDLLKKKVKRSLDHDSENYRYFNFMKAFICDTTLDQNTRTKLNVLKKPQLECNEIEQFVNALLGEFRNYEPSITVKPSTSITDPGYKARQYRTAEVIEGYLRHKLSNSHTDNANFEVMSDLLRGGLSAGTLEIGWKSEDIYEFDVDLIFNKEPYPTMCGWDPAAVHSHRGDGKYCFRIFAYTKDQVEEKYGEEAIENIRPQAGIEGFSWSYYQDEEEYYVFCEFYEKEIKKVKTVFLSTPFPQNILARLSKYSPSRDGRKMTMACYKAALIEWENEGLLEVPPIPVQEKMADKIKICKYIFNEAKIISYEDTDYAHLPIIRAQGGSVKLEDNLGANKRDKCRSFVHNLVGIQMLKNTAAQGVAYEIENTVAHKWLMEYETVIPEQMQQLINNQIPSVLLWQSRPRRADSQSEAYPEPQPVVRPPVPEIIPQTFYETSVAMRRMMGTIENNNVPGGNIASDTLKMAYTQESRAAYPWWQGFESFLNRLGTCYMDLIPKIFKTPTTIPIINIDGKRDFVSINDVNDPNSVFMDFSPNDFNIEITAGVNAEVLRQTGMNQIMELSRTFQGFNRFIDTECQPELIENIDIKNKGSLVMKSQEWQQKQAQMAQLSAQNAPLDPAKAQLQIAQMNMMQKEKDRQLEAAKVSAEIQNDNRKTDADIIKTMSQVKNEAVSATVRQQEVDAKNLHTAVSLVSSLAKQKSDSRQFHTKLAHEHKMKSMEHEHSKEMKDSSDMGTDDNE